MVCTRSATLQASRWPRFGVLSDDLVREVLLRTPSYSHDILAAVCKLFNQIIRDQAFFPLRQQLGLAESALLAFGGYDKWGRGGCHQGMAALIAGQWCYLADPPVWGEHDVYNASFNDHLVLVGGGQDECDFGPGGRHFMSETPEGLQVHVYDFVGDQWNKMAPLGTLPQHRMSAACAAMGDLLVLAGGVLEVQAGDDIDEHTTNTVLALVLKRTGGQEDGGLNARWRELPSMPQAVSGADAFVLDGNLYVAGGRSAIRSETSTSIVQMLTVENKWLLRAPLPCEFDCGAVHSGRFFGVHLNENDAPTIYAYDPGTDTWELNPPLDMPVPKLLMKEAYSGGRSMASCGEGILVLGTSSGTVAMLQVLNGKIVSARSIWDEDWMEQVSSFAQDYRLTGLCAASFDLSSECKPVLVQWARAVEQAQITEEECTDGEEEVTAVPNIAAAKALLANASLPSAEELHKRWLAGYEERLARAQQMPPAADARTELARQLSTIQ